MTMGKPKTEKIDWFFLQFLLCLTPLLHLYKWKEQTVRTQDGHLIQKCLDGDSAAFGFLVDKYRQSVYALAYSRLGNFHDAEDVTQEAFITAYEKLHTLKRWENFYAWLYAITSNLCKMWFRSRANRPDREYIEDQDEETLDAPSMEAGKTVPMTSKL